MNALKNYMSADKELIDFENNRWARGPQEYSMRHRLALPLVVSGPVLDVGGGDGLFASLLEQATEFKVSVIDASSVAIAMARERGLVAHIQDISVALPFPSKSFGTACALDVLEHVRNPLALLREMTRVAESVVISVPNFNFVSARFAMFFGYVPFQSRPRRGHVYWFNPIILMALAREAGLRPVVISYGPIIRLGFLGRLLAQFLPSLFADSVVARFIPMIP
jgi:2-polyprenyl-3-methyl-5-hydroxy-6-metoxy-1,4-benzoquinol methylase